MWKILILTILIIGCDPTMATKYNTATATDTDGTKFVSAADLDRKGLIRASLTNWATTAKPNVAQESIVENGGTGFKTDTVGGDSISLTDPDTALTVADGDVYIVLNGDSADAGYGDYSFTATVPTWSDTKQGYYLTGLTVDYRAIGGCNILAGVYTGKYLYFGREGKMFSFFFSEYTEKIATEKTTTAVSPTDITPTFANPLYVNSGDIIDVMLKIELKSDSAQAKYQTAFVGTCNFVSDTNKDVTGEGASTEDGLAVVIETGSTGSYVPGFTTRRIFIISDGTLLFKEQLETTSGAITAYVRNRNIYYKKVNTIKVDQ